MTTLIKIAFRNVGRNKRRTAFCLTAVGIAVFFIAVFSSFRDGQLKSVYEIMQSFELGHVKVVTARFEEENEYMPVQYPVASGPENPGGKNWKDLSASIGEIPGVKAVFPRITAIATLQESTIKHAILRGIMIEEEKQFHHFNLVNRDDGIVEGRYPAPGANECAVGYVFAKKSGLGIGDKLPLKTISAQFSDKMWSPVITGIFNYEYYKADEQYIIVDYDRLQRLLVLDEGAQQLIIYADKEELSGAIAASVRNMLGEGNIVTEWRDNRWVALFSSNLVTDRIIGSVFLIVASFLIINTVMMIVHERIKEIGMMGSLGMSRGEIIMVFFFESIFLAGLGALSGTILGGIVSGIGQYFPLRVMEQYGSSVSEAPMSTALFLVFSVKRLFQAWLMGVAIASAFTLFPSLKSALVEPVEALRR